MARIDPPYEFIAEGLRAGEVVPFFGAAASDIEMVGRTPRSLKP